LSKTGDVCFTAQRDPLGQNMAQNDCTDEGLRIPSLSEAKLAQRAADSNVNIWTDNLYYTGSAIKGVTMNMNAPSTYIDEGTPTPYRCVTSAGARP